MLPPETTNRACDRQVSGTQRVKDAVQSQSWQVMHACLKRVRHARTQNSGGLLPVMEKLDYSRITAEAVRWCVRAQVMLQHGTST